MGQQPNIEITEADKPRKVPEPPVAEKWRSSKPGIPTAPEEVPSGGKFGHAGPDAGWGLRLLRKAEMPSNDPRLARVVEGLMMARAAKLGRAPVPEDIEVALTLCGYGFPAPPEVIEMRNRWLEAVPHESRPGATAVADVDPDLLANKPEQVRWALTHSV